MTRNAPGSQGAGPRGHVPMRTDFESFHRAHRADLIRTLAVAVGNLDLAEEAVDVAMTRLWSRWRVIEDPAPWTYRVARNWATSWWRRRRRISWSPVPDQPVPGPAGDTHPELTAALAGLSQDHRDVIALRFVAGYSVDDAATALGVAPGTVKSRTARAVQRLRTAMEVTR